MPWKAVDTMSLREQFVSLALNDGTNIALLCRRFGISRKTGYKWINRFLERGADGLMDRSRRPASAPYQTGTKMERKILLLRDIHHWGGRKIRKRLIDLGFSGVPAASTISGILKRNGRVDPRESAKHTAYKRFEKAAPNDLWQMDFKGHFPINSGRCHPLGVLDDHSRYSLGLRACSNERKTTVKDCLTAIFRRHGVPAAILADNGSPWGTKQGEAFTGIEVWLMLVGVDVRHGRAKHPQTQGKEERFHRTLKAELVNHERFTDLAHCQRRFDWWRHVYNHERPHEALGMEVPASRYRPSDRVFPETLPSIEYGPEDLVRKVGKGGIIHYGNRKYRVGKAFTGYPVGLRPTDKDGVFRVFFRNTRIATLNERISHLEPVEER